jgi:hypothetical protein
MAMQGPQGRPTLLVPTAASLRDLVAANLEAYREAWRTMAALIDHGIPVSQETRYWLEGRLLLLSDLLAADAKRPPPDPTNSP